MAIPDFNFGTGDWEIECYVKPTGFVRTFGTLLANSQSTWAAGSRFIMILRATQTLNVGGFNAVTGGASYEVSGNPLIQSSVPLVDGVWTHVVVNKVGTLVRVWLDGVLRGSGTSSAPWNFGAPGALLGSNGWDGTLAWMSALVHDMRVRRSPLRTAAFERPPPPDYFPLFSAPRLITPGGDELEAVCNGGTAAALDGSVAYRHLAMPALDIVRPTVAASSQLNVARMPYAKAALARDVEFGGTGRIWGTTKTKATPSNLPTKARVVLLHQRSKQLVRETWSDSTTGAFAFEGIDTRQEFLTLAEDAAGAYRPVAASRLVPEVPA